MMKLIAVFSPLLLMVAFNASAASDYPPCSLDYCSSTITTTTTVYNLGGTANIYDNNTGRLFFPTISATGTLTYSTWYDSSTGEGGEDALVNINALDLGLAPVVSSYTWATDSTGLVTDYTSEEFGFESDSTLLDSVNVSQWNYLIGGPDLVSVYTLSGVGAAILGGNKVTINYQLSQVPVPAAIWLFASGIMVLAGLARRRVI